MSGPKGGCCEVSPRQRARIAAESAAEGFTRWSNDYLTRAGSSIGPALRDALTAQARSANRRASSIRSAESVQALREGLSSTRSEWERLRSSMQNAKVALSDARAAATALEQSLDQLLGDGYAYLGSRRAQLAPWLESPPAVPPSDCKDPAAGAAALDALVERARAFVAEFEGTQLDIEMKAFELTADQGEQIERGKSFLEKDSGDTPRTPPKTEPSRLYGDALRVRLESLRETLGDAAAEPLAEELERIASSETLLEKARLRRLKSLKDRCQAAVSAHLSWAEIKDLLQGLDPLSEDGPAELRTQRANLIDRADRLLVDPEPARNDMERFRRSFEEHLSAMQEAAEQRAAHDYVELVVRESLEELGYNVFETSQTIDFGKQTSSLLAETPGGECLVFQHQDDGQFQAQIVANSEDSSIDEAQVHSVRHEMEEWCSKFEAFLARARERGVDLETNFRVPVRDAAIRTLASSPANIRRRSSNSASVRARER